MPVNQNLASQNSASQNIVILTDQNFIGHNLASQNPTSQNIVVLTDQNLAGHLAVQNLAGQNFTSPTNQNLADQSIAGQLQGKSSGDNDTRLLLKHTKRRNTVDLTSDDDTHTVASQAADLVPTLVPTYPGSVQPSSHAPTSSIEVRTVPEHPMVTRAHKPWSTWNVARFRYSKCEPLQSVSMQSQTQADSIYSNKPSNTCAAIRTSLWQRARSRNLSIARMGAAPRAQLLVQ